MKIEYYNLYTHFVFTTHHRAPVILESARERIEKYITGIVKNHDSRMFAIYANPDHMHFLVSRSPMISEYLLATTLSRSSGEFIRKNDLIEGNFQWQNTCSAFSVSKSDVDIVCKYILNQPQHHKTVSFADEYNAMLKHYQTGSRWDYLK
jgi:REP element-mobilizing transposase RayT